ncbi:MAG TPA: PHP domain-containing protein, partial [Anaerovoracaceae bacterium]|nr:PHP domain-containing protein [Anaerovoracaceae bacterium]
MKQLIDSTIRWQSIGDHKTEEYSYSIEKAVINKEKAVLNLSLRLNFVIPYVDVERLEALIKNQISLLQDVKFNFVYEDVVLTTEEIIRNFIPHMIHIVNGKYATITKTINTENFTYTGDTLELLALGELATAELNKSIAPKFAELLKENFGFNVQVSFANNENLYIKTSKEMKQKEEEAAREAASAARAAAAANPGRETQTAKPAFSGNGGYGGGQFGQDGKPAYRRREKETPAQGNRIMGKGVSGEPVSLEALTPELGTVVIEGVLFKKSARTIKNEKKLVTILITDKKTTVCLKAFTSDNKWQEIDTLLDTGDFIKVRGEAQWDTYDNCLVVMAKDIEKGQVPVREDNYQGLKRVELHAHTKMSAMDGLNEVEDLVKKAAFWGQPAVAITDHGVVQGFPDAAKTAGKLKKDNKDIKVIYGLEGYVFDDSDCVCEDGSIDFKKNPTNHIIILAKTQEGLKNIYKLVSYSHLDYFYKRPRLPKSVIAANREGLIIGSACEAGEVFRAVLDNLPQERVEEIAGFYDYLEIQPIINNQFLIENGRVADKEGLRELNRRIVALADKLDKPVVATTDAHYDEPDSAIYRNILMAGQGYK